MPSLSWTATELHRPPEETGWSVAQLLNDYSTPSHPNADPRVHDTTERLASNSGISQGIEIARAAMTN